MWINNTENNKLILIRTAGCKCKTVVNFFTMLDYSTFPGMLVNLFVTRLDCSTFPGTYVNLVTRVDCSTFPGTFVNLLCYQTQLLNISWFICKSCLLPGSITQHFLVHL